MTIDKFLDGRLKVRQPRIGYRFSIDAVLLANHIDPRPGDTVVDLGTGCGIIPMILTYRHPDIAVIGVELQAGLADMAKCNIKDNAMDDRISILCGDMKALQPDQVNGPVDLVVTNPPYRLANSGRINPNRQRAVARHEIKASLNDVVQTARRIMRVSGRLVTIYPAERLTDIITCMRDADIEPKFLRTIHSTHGSEAKIILIEGKKGARPGIEIGPALIIYGPDRGYTDEVEKMFAP